MNNEPTKKNDQSTSYDRPAEQVNELPPKKVTEKDADTVKGGARNERVK
jgi:hypothetical protein